MDITEEFHELDPTDQNCILTESLLSNKHPELFTGCRLYTAGEVLPSLTRFGIFNPSVVKVGDLLYIVYRAEPSEVTWGGHFLEEKAVPVFQTATIEGDRVVKEGEILPVVGGTAFTMRQEDWRLFSDPDTGEVYSNFTNYFYFNPGWPQEDVRSTTCVSRLVDNRFEFLRELTPAHLRAPRREEKNWLIFKHRGEWLCIYSLEPYILFSLNSGFGVDSVKKFSEKPLSRVHQSFLANGANPVFNDTPSLGPHYLVFCHNYTHAVGDNKRNRTYYHYAAVLSYDTLDIIGFTENPVVGGGDRDGRHDQIMYVSGVHIENNRIFLFYGEGDTHSEYCSFPEDLVYDNLTHVS